MSPNFYRLAYFNVTLFIWEFTIKVFLYYSISFQILHLYKLYKLFFRVSRLLKPNQRIRKSMSCIGVLDNSFTMIGVDVFKERKKDQGHKNRQWHLNFSRSNLMRSKKPKETSTREKLKRRNSKDKTCGSVSTLKCWDLVTN